MKKLYFIILTGLLHSFSLQASYSITKFPDPGFCTATYPTSYVSGNFSIVELSINGTTGFKKGQNNKFLTIGFNNAVFSFNPGVGSVSASGSEITIVGYTITATQIIVKITTAGSNSQYNAINFNNIEVRANSAGSAIIARTGGTQSFLIDNSNNKPNSTTSWGDLNAGDPYFYSSNSTSQLSTANVVASSVNNQILRVQVDIGGDCGSALSTTSFSFTTAGSGLATQNPATNLAAAKLYYTGSLPFFSTGTLFGSLSNPNGAFVISGTQTFASAGTYYFWLTYDIAATPNNGEIVDASFVALNVGGTSYAATSGNPAGSRTINNNTFYSRNASVWSNNTTKWSLTSFGPACSCVPTAGAVVYISHATSLDINSPILAQVNILNGGSLTDANRTLNTTDALTTSGTGIFQATNAWTLKDVITSGTGASSTTQALTITGDLLIGAGTSVQLIGGNALTVDGNISIDGLLAMGTSNGASSNAAGTLIVGTGSITGSGILTLGIAKDILSSTSLTISPVISVSNNRTITNYGNILMLNNITGGGGNATWVNASGSVLTMSGTTSALLASGILNASAIPNTVSYSGSGAQTIKSPLNAIYHHLVANNAGTKTVGAAVTVNGDITIGGSAQVSTGANSILLNGNWINNSSNATPFSSTGTVFFNGANDMVSGSGITSFNIVNITSSGLLTAHSVAGRILVLGNWINDGDFDHNNSDITFNGTSTISGGSTTAFKKIIVNTTRALTLHATETDIEGDLTVNGTGTMAHNNGLVVFGGNANSQNINGNTTILTFYQFEIDNSSGLVTLARPVTINNSLTLTDGKIVTTTTNILLLISGAVSSSGNATSFVEGPIRKTGSTAFAFPVGRGSRWARIGIGASSAATNSYRAEYFDAAFTNTSSMAVAPSPTLHHISLIEYWQLDRIVGTGTPAVTLYWEDAASSVINDCSTNDLRIAHWNGAAWENNNEAVTTAGGCVGSQAGSISTSNGVTAFSPFTFGSKSTNNTINILPIGLLEFSAKCKIGGVNLLWSTAIELNNSHFIIERSFDAVTWIEIAEIPGAGTSAVKKDYSFSDKFQANQIVYYRLSQLDFSGAKKVFKTVYADCAAQSSALNIYPNPASDQFAIEITSELQNNEAELVIIDQLGRICFRQKVLLQKGENLYQLDLSLQSGIYSVRVIGANTDLPSQKLVIQ